MRKLFNQIAGILILAVLAYALYEYIAAGYLTRPEMPENSFSLSFKNGLRGIMVGIPDEGLDREYLAQTFEVPFWAEDAWSFCNRPTKQEAEKYNPERRLGPGSRLEAICKLDIEGSIINRGVVYSVPRL